MCIIVNLQLSEIKCDLQKVLVAEICCRVEAGSGGAVRVTDPRPAMPNGRHSQIPQTATNCCNSHIMPQQTLTYNQGLMFTYT